MRRVCGLAEAMRERRAALRPQRRKADFETGGRAATAMLGARDPVGDMLGDRAVEALRHDVRSRIPASSSNRKMASTCSADAPPACVSSLRRERGTTSPSPPSAPGGLQWLRNPASRTTCVA